MRAATLREEPDPSRFQVFEWPEIRTEVTEHRAHTLKCPACATETSEVLPAEVLLHGFGPRMTAVAAYLTGRCRLSKRQVSELFIEALGTPMMPISARRIFGGMSRIGLIDPPD